MPMERVRATHGIGIGIGVLLGFDIEWESGSVPVRQEWL
jgi:hypothetical protein